MLECCAEERGSVVVHVVDNVIAVVEVDEMGDGPGLVAVNLGDSGVDYLAGQKTVAEVETGWVWFVTAERTR